MPVEIDADVREEYWTQIRIEPHRVHDSVAKPLTLSHRPLPSTQVVPN